MTMTMSGYQKEEGFGRFKSLEFYQVKGSWIGMEKALWRFWYCFRFKSSASREPQEPPREGPGRC